MAELPTPQAPPDPALSALQELPLPSPVPYTPQTVGWWMVAALLLLLLAWLGWRWYMHRQANRYRTEALGELERIAQDLVQKTGAHERQALGACLAALVKRVALVSAPRQAIASLSGEAWLQWLDQTLPRAGFLDAPGRLLPQLAYGGAQEVEPQALQALLTLLRRWIKEHRVHL